MIYTKIYQVAFLARSYIVMGGEMTMRCEDFKSQIENSEVNDWIANDELTFSVFRYELKGNRVAGTKHESMP